MQLSVTIHIVVIYSGYEGCRYPTFWNEGYHTSHFSGQKDEEFAVMHCVNRGNLQKFNYNKTVLGRDPAGRASLRCSSRSQSWMRSQILPPNSPSLAPRDPSVPRSPSELVPSRFRPKLRPDNTAIHIIHMQFNIHLQIYTKQSKFHAINISTVPVQYVTNRNDKNKTHPFSSLMMTTPLMLPKMR